MIPQEVTAILQSPARFIFKFLERQSPSGKSQGARQIRQRSAIFCPSGRKKRMGGGPGARASGSGKDGFGTLREGVYNATNRAT
jgi:hypothetical protein